MPRLIHSSELLHLDRPMVLVPLDEYESLVFKALSPFKNRPLGRDRGPRRKLLGLLGRIRREKGRTFRSSKDLAKHLASL